MDPLYSRGHGIWSDMTMISAPSSSDWEEGDSSSLASFVLVDSDPQQYFEAKAFRGSDAGLGKWIGWAGVLPSGEQIEILKYPDGPNPDEYYLRANKGRNFAAILAEVVAILELTEDQITWRSKA